MLLVCLKKYTTKRYLELEWILTHKYFIKIQNFVCYHAPHASDKTRFFEELLLTRLNKIIEDRKLITNFSSDSDVSIRQLTIGTSNYRYCEESFR